MFQVNFVEDGKRKSKNSSYENKNKRKFKFKDKKKKRDIWNDFFLKKDEIFNNKKKRMMKKGRWWWLRFIDWLILMAYKFLLGYLMPRIKEIAFIVRIYLYFCVFVI